MEPENGTTATAEFTRADAVSWLLLSARLSRADEPIAEALRRKAKRVKVANNWLREYEAETLIPIE